MKTVLLILFAHFVADFICQTDKQAINKSKSNLWLTYHVLGYSFVMLILSVYIFGFTDNAIVWVVLNGVFHWLTDWVTSRINSYLWKKEMRHWFFVGIGIDQFIHYSCLLLTYQYIN